MAKMANGRVSPACKLDQLSEERGGSVVECLTRESAIKGLWVRASPEALRCVLEQDTLPS